MFHISDIKQFNKCPRSYFLNKTYKESFFSFYRNDYSIIDIYKDYFNIEDCFIGKTGDSPALVLDNLDKYDYFINARFATSDIRVKASLLHRINDGYSLYFFKPMLPKDLDLLSLYITYDVLRKNNINITNIYIIYVNKDYILTDTIDFKKALVVIDTFNNNSIFDLVSNYDYDYISVINDIKKYDFNSCIDLNKNCGSCEYFNECFKDDFDDDSIMHLVSSKYKYDMYCEGLKKFCDVDTNRIDCTSLQYAQIIASKNKGMFIDKKRLKEFMNQISNNIISFIDFEWDCFLFPKYKNMKTFGLLPFEFSLYIKNGEDISNHCYVGKGDCREEFIKTLISLIPQEGPIVAYNSFSAEVLRLEELAVQFPKYKNELESIIKRFVDIAEVFSKGIIYDIKYQGQLSLKKVVSVISDISYKNLSVKDGLDAVVNFREYEKTDDENIKNNLIKYCNQDSYSLIVIYNYLFSLI